MRIGIIGAGQLGRMLALAGRGMGMEFVFLDPARSPCASDFGEHREFPFSDTEALARLSADCDLVTYEFENVPAAGLSVLAKGDAPIYPPIAALSVSQNRCDEKAFFESLGITVAPWHSARTAAELESALQGTKGPAVVKTATLGYDGKGQRRANSGDDATALFGELGGVPLCVESRVDFDYEISVIGARGRDGKVKTYPVCRNSHVDGILNQTRVDAEPHPLQSAADAVFTQVANALDYVGTLTIELFVYGDQLVANEMAPRVHNSGHWTLGGAATSQFENHLRAICGLPLGQCSALGFTGLQNFVGALPSAQQALKAGAAAFQDYQKTARVGRKVGHAVVLESSLATREAALARLSDLRGWEI